MSKRLARGHHISGSFFHCRRPCSGDTARLTAGVTLAELSTELAADGVADVPTLLSEIAEPRAREKIDWLIGKSALTVGAATVLEVGTPVVVVRAVDVGFDFDLWSASR